MKVITGHFESWPPPGDGSVVTVGVFDGVHRGHLAVIGALEDHAVTTGLVPTVVTFDPHPASVVSPRRVPRLLTSTPVKLRLLAAAGVPQVAVVRFDEEMREMSGAVFVDEVLVRALAARAVVAGPDFRFGKGRSGDAATLRGGGLEVISIDPVGDGEVVSSTAIRGLIGDGRVEEASGPLGRPFMLPGVVVRGEGRGAGFGFPTANLDIDPRLILPGHGVYAVMVGLGGSSHRGVANVGVRPTFGEDRETVEVHLLDGAGDLYGRELEISFHHWLRAEQRFDGVDALIAQIERDVAEARRLLPTP